ELVDLERSRLAKAQIREVRDQLAVEPHRNAAIALARRVRLDHELVAVPPAELGNHIGARNEIRAEITRSLIERHDTPGRIEMVSPDVPLLRVIDIDVEEAGVGHAGRIASRLVAHEELVEAVGGDTGTAIIRRNGAAV